MIGNLTTFSGVISVHLHPPISIKSTSIKSPAAVNRPESLYEVLRVERTATPTEIKAAYRKLAKVYHPDACDVSSRGGDGDFIEIYKAYVTLSDPVTRETYDLTCSGGVRRKVGLDTAVGRRQGFCSCRRWETDQCW
ncbi:chaperone protein dnaJ 11, chloroplastic-like [Bidens hawaiensis]|uniref:chaperone protein dnaJ 11, chloroplastic-like n=1 Tax=Bidens hawaiensis TaxID=980011 RepID=UPI00404B4296